MRPSDLLEIPRTRSNSALRFQVDEAVVDFMTWVEGKAEEREVGKIQGKQPGKGETWVPKYKNVADILAEYGPGTEPETPAIDPTEIAAVIAELEASQDAEF